MLGVHSRDREEVGKVLLLGVEIFGKYFELKKSVETRKMQQEEKRIGLRTIRNPLLPPP